MKKIKFKDILKEAAWDRTAGKALPTLEDVQKAYQEKKQLQEEYIESMDHKAIDKHLSAIEMQWLDWKRGSMTEKSDIKPAGDELTHYILLWMRKKFK
tara:strand:- start:216 stop:509 length:294 start_codon:yes stop_codon:yes gene_type:complete